MNASNRFSQTPKKRGGVLDQKVLDFYESLAARYHLIFEDWDRAIDRQAKVLDPLLHVQSTDRPLKILDCACGIGTQAIGFAKLGHTVTASDLSEAAVTRARQEAEIRGVDISFLVSDMTSMSEITESTFDVVAAMDNALPHLSRDEVRRALRAIGSKLAQNGRFIASIRDYDELLNQRPTMQQPAFYGDAGERRIVHQVWDWIDAERYIVHLYITEESRPTWTTHHFVSEYRCILRSELTNELESAGFKDVQWLMPGQSGYYQPIVLARFDPAS
ncbi:class I SAM-dependent methyltransferase [Terriglobus saanensis]|uniref:Methyltransferase type 11 n=1 Tax=Terriglobus saanensis (strain ATCC BAA-1853 / DSM 23119 / SP1PR4) TaxID=401053 RepID=E8V0M0_TERSS|nr:class I SAM-dependent methyltransferase [Terriglobus saanensis]ADV81083.1 Methyltransferase type 11 [Terriglobus saanensis SP1PR4]